MLLNISVVVFPAGNGYIWQLEFIFIIFDTLLNIICGGFSADNGYLWQLEFIFIIFDTLLNIILFFLQTMATDRGETWPRGSVWGVRRGPWSVPAGWASGPGVSLPRGNPARALRQEGSPRGRGYTSAGTAVETRS